MRAIISIIFLFAYISNIFVKGHSLYFTAVDEACKVLSRGEGISLNTELIAKERQNAFRRCVSSKAAAMLHNIWTQNSVLNEKQAKEVYEDFLNNYENNQILDIYVTAIDELYNLENPALIAHHLCNTYFTGNLSSLEIGLKAQLYLHKKFMSLEDINEKYLLTSSICFSKMKSDALYKQLDNSLIKRLKDALRQYPAAMTEFLNQPSFCLKNKEYGTYIYTTVEGGFEHGNLKEVFVWEVDSPVGIEGRWYKSHEKVTDKNAFHIRGTKLNLYLFVQLEKMEWSNMVMTWRNPLEIPVNSEWQVEFVDDFILMKQNNLTMCASERTHDAERRYVYAVDKKSAQDYECLWEVDQC